MAVLLGFGVASGHDTLGDEEVVMVEDRWDVDAVRAGHAVVAGGAGHGLQLDELLGYLHQEFVLLGGDGPQR